MGGVGREEGFDGPSSFGVCAICTGVPLSSSSMKPNATKFVNAVAPKQTPRKSLKLATVVQGRLPMSEVGTRWYLRTMVGKHVVILERL